MNQGHSVRDGFTCPRCGMTSHNPTDLLEGYCGACHDTTGGVYSRLAFEYFIQHDRLPEWRQRWIRDKAVRSAVHDALRR